MEYVERSLMMELSLWVDGIKVLGICLDINMFNRRMKLRVW